ncbi:hypothetical protein A3D88_01075 [Candidatus Peribacteria bacterium RIFCSPHIGHO2_02_FULL_52_16]|nr:MAG: hypothetical protein A2706_05720 [Candidatus Peribacteria bacterium RIFCSPHIGHO2_01_FULL_51_35]OGJ61258.1 MAG: hypothetical protein A3D88_01075 [Candidatus Peribacteria bacterium RIFCSPHIGHO2_02_FULL_52_16]
MVNSPRSNSEGIKQKSSLVRWLQFSTRSLLLLMAFTGVGGAYSKYRMDEQRKEQKTIEKGAEAFSDAIKQSIGLDEYSISPEEYKDGIVKIENIPSKK